MFGIAAMTYTTSLTIINWADEGPKMPGYCDKVGH